MCPVQVEAGLTGFGNVDLETGFAEIVLNHLGKTDIVLDQENLLGHSFLSCRKLRVACAKATSLKLLDPLVQDNPLLRRQDHGDIHNHSGQLFAGLVGECKFFRPKRLDGIAVNLWCREQLVKIPGGGKRGLFVRIAFPPRQGSGWRQCRLSVLVSRQSQWQTCPTIRLTRVSISTVLSS